MAACGHIGRKGSTWGQPDSAHMTQPQIHRVDSPTGQRSLHHRGDSLDTLVLLNPSDKSLCDEVGTSHLPEGAGCRDLRMSHPDLCP